MLSVTILYKNNYIDNFDEKKSGFRLKTIEFEWVKKKEKQTQTTNSLPKHDDFSITKGVGIRLRRSKDDLQQRFNMNAKQKLKSLRNKWIN